ncbi:hypothetical protein QT972_10390 [Microcoleus sp. herbarium7]|uniref:TPR end-of-group domain-containing protein n=1 Tax=Microcoleus sp. herbarium7 TaxID=3055435 RepID=UPI002FD4842C
MTLEKWYKTTSSVDCIARAIELNRSKYLSLAQTDPDLKPLHKNKRFQKLLGKTFC